MKKNSNKETKVGRSDSADKKARTPSNIQSVDKRIKDLLDFINDTGLQEVFVETEDITLKVKRSPNIKVDSFTKQYNPFSLDTVSDSNSIRKISDNDNSDTAQSTLSANCFQFKSPMIGTFYRSSNPESSPYVKEGDLVSKGQVLCVIEAMKLFNEIEAEKDGKIAKILINDASPVEYDQPLFLIEEL